MNVPVRLLADPDLLAWMMQSRALEQLLALAMLPGVAEPVVGLPNLDEGDGFPAGAVLATRVPDGVEPGGDGVIVPAGTGPDINCGLRLLRSPLAEGDIEHHLVHLLDALAAAVPIGNEVGGRLRFTAAEVDRILEEGPRFLVERRGIGLPEDVEESMEPSGRAHEAHVIHLAEPTRALGHHQLGTLGSGGSHFVEIEVVERIYDKAAAARMGLFPGQVVVLIHAGARALGQRAHAECLALARKAMVRLRLGAPAPRLFYAPLDSNEGKWCYHALRAAANFGWANRHVIGHQVRAAFSRIAGPVEMPTVYDCDNNTIELEHRPGRRVLCVHRRAAACAFAASAKHLPVAYRDLGAPVLLPGSMGAGSYLLVAQGAATDLALSSAAHGAGRALSRGQARRTFAFQEIERELSRRGILLRCASHADITEEAPAAYRDLDRAAEILDRAGIARKVARLRPRAVLKG